MTYRSRKTTNEEEIYLKNPTYYDGRASSVNAPAVVAYDVIANCPSQARTGQTYNVLNRGQATGTKVNNNNNAH